MKLLRVLLFLFGSFTCTLAWDNDQLEVFDVVEEVNQNFYELMGLTQNANASDIKKAFRRLSLLLHPDKNPSEDAELKFRNLVAVYDVLKDSKKREHYHDVLINGLPNWRSGVYYYRFVRKIGLLEMSIILFIVITIGQYLVAWGAYVEKRYTYEQVLGSKIQKLQKKSRKSKMDVPNLAEILEKIPVPSVWNTLPFQLPRWIYCSIVGIPSTIRSIKEFIAERKRQKLLEKEKKEAEAQESEPEPEPVPRGPRRRRQAFTPQERKEREAAQNIKQNHVTENVSSEKPVITGGLWTDDDILDLIKLVNKYPGGTQDKWIKIAEAMNRSVSEVTHMAKKVKDEGLKPGQPTDEEVEDDQPKKVKTRVEVTDDVSNWSQDQQKALEAALIKFPKSNNYDRWEKVAKCVEGKTKEECQMRYRQLVELVKKKQT